MTIAELEKFCQVGKDRCRASIEWLEDVLGNFSDVLASRPDGRRIESRIESSLHNCRKMEVMFARFHDTVERAKAIDPNFEIGS